MSLDEEYRDPGEGRIHFYGHELSPGPHDCWRPEQSRNVTDPVEGFLSSAEAISAAFVKALMVDRHVLFHYQRCHDVLMAFRTLRDASSLDARPIVATT